MIKNNIITNDEYIKLENHVLDILYIRNKNSMITLRDTIKNEINLFFPDACPDQVIASLKAQSKIAEIEYAEIVLLDVNKG